VRGLTGTLTTAAVDVRGVKVYLNEASNDELNVGADISTAGMNVDQPIILVFPVRQNNSNNNNNNNQGIYIYIYICLYIYIYIYLYIYRI